MNDALPAPAAFRPLWLRLLAGLLTLLVVLALLLAFFPWDLLRGPLNRYVSERTGRHFEITRKLDVKLGLTTRVLADGIAFANPEWAQDSHLVKAESAEIDVRLLPLLHRRIELPLITLHKPVLGLQVEPDGRRTWALGRDTADAGNFPVIGSLVVDEGAMHYVASEQGADIHTDFAIDGNSSDKLPLTFKAHGTWKKEAFSAKGHTGNVLHLTAPLQQPFPADVEAVAANTALHVSGAVTSLATLEGADANFNLQGSNLSELYKLLGVVLPETPRYAIKGHLSKQGDVWHVSRLDGRLGNSDIGGELSFDRSQPVPLLTGKVQSRALDFDDLAPLVGLPEQPRSVAALPQVAAPAAAKSVARTSRPSSDRGRKVLPTAALDLVRLKAMNADVRYSAVRITNVRQLPLDRMSVHVGLKDGVLLLDPMDLGVAGGNIVGRIRINGNSNPALAEVKLDARSMELGKLFPGAKITQASFGKIHGLIDLKGRGNSVAQMLGTSSGNVAMLMGRGEISNLMLEIAGLDGGEILKFLVSGDRNVQLRCAAASFVVDNGAMDSRTLVLDTSDTVIYGAGFMSLANESLDLTLRPYPKDKSILALRSPLKVSGTFAAPHAGVDKGALAGRAGLVLALGAINPLLGLAATIETGPGKDADCSAVLKEAAAPAAAARAAAAGVPPPSKPAGGATAPEAHAPASASEKLARKGSWTNEQIYRQ